MGSPCRGPGVGDAPGQSRSRRCLRRAQPDRVLVGAGASGEVPGHGPQTVATHSRGLAHADAAHAAGLVDARTGSDERRQPAAGDEIGEDLPRGRVDIEGHLPVDLAALEDLGDDGEVTQSRIRRGADDDLEDLLIGALAHGTDIARRGRCCDEGFER